MGAKITLKGNLGDEPRHGIYQNDKGEDRHWVSFSVRQPHFVKNDKNEFIDKGGFWMNVSWFSYKSETAAKVLKKGAAVVVTGDLHVEYWTDKESGEERADYRVVADEVSIDMRAIESISFRTKNTYKGPQPQPNVGKRAEKADAPPAAVTQSAADGDGWEDQEVMTQDIPLEENASDDDIPF